MPPTVRTRPVLRTATGAELPATLSPREAAHLLGTSRSTAYDLIRAGHWPTPVTKSGFGAQRVLTVPLLEHLRIPFEFIQVEKSLG